MLSLTPLLCNVAPSFLLFAAIVAVALSAGDVRFAAGCWILRHFGDALWLLVPLVFHVVGDASWLLVPLVLDVVGDALWLLVPLVLHVVGNASWLLVPLVLHVVGIVAFLVLFLCAAPLFFCVVGTGAAAFLLTFALLLALRCGCWHCDHCCFCLSSCTAVFCAALVRCFLAALVVVLALAPSLVLLKPLLALFFVICMHGCFLLLELALAF